MSIDVKQVVAMLEKSAGENIISIYIPSLKASVMFRPLTVGMQKTLSKTSMDLDYDVKYQYLKMSVIKSCCLDNMLDIENLTEVDFICILANFRKANFLEPLKLNLTCKQNECNEKLSFNLNFDQIVENCNKFEFKTIELENPINATTKIKYILAEPTITDHLDYLQNLQVIGEDKELSQSIDINNMQILTYPVQFIKRVFINDQEVTTKDQSFSKMPFTERLQFIDKLPINSFYDGPNNIAEKIIETFDPMRISKLFPIITCPKCKDIKESVVTQDSFFII